MTLGLSNGIKGKAPRLLNYWFCTEMQIQGIFPNSYKEKNVGAYGMGL
jgi:hypothetical protein